MKMLKEQSDSISQNGDLRMELGELMKRKMDITESLAALEKQIYAFEGSYLEDTHLFGNVVRGWNFAPLATKNQNSVDKKLKKVKDSERLFSRSSVTSEAAINEKNINTFGKRERVSDTDSDEECFNDQNGLKESGNGNKKSSKKRVKKNKKIRSK